jgi:hypothetical protein
MNEALPARLRFAKNPASPAIEGLPMAGPQFVYVMK